MSSKLFQNLVNQVRDITSLEFGIMDENGLILACSDEKKVWQNSPMAAKVMRLKDTSVVMDGMTFQKILIRNKLEYIAFIESDKPDSLKYLSLIALNIVNMKVYYDEKFDRNSFIKSIIMDNVLPGDISLKAKELHLTIDASRVVFLIKTEKPRDADAHDVIQYLFPSKSKDFVIVLDDESTVLIKELKSSKDTKEIDKTAKIIADTLSTELMVKVFIGIGTVVENIRDLGRSFKEAQMALLIGGIFDSDKPIINYNSLGIGRLIYQLPTTLCRLFLKEVFKESSFEAFDAETLLTIQKFFDNDLNVSETSRELYVHRNTLVYRLDKIQKMTGLDLRKFDDAIILKVAMLVKKYLDKCEKPV